MKRASIELKIAERENWAMLWLRLAAERRREGMLNDARVALRTSRLWPAPALPDRKAA